MSDLNVALTLHEMLTNINRLLRKSTVFVKRIKN